MVEDLVTIIVPFYNAEDCLKRCVDSLRKQSYGKLEIILVDDGSTDCSSEIADCLALIDCRIKVIHQKNEGVSQARNQGVKQAQGEWISFVDADDYVESDYIEQLLPQNDDVQMSLCGMMRLCNDGEEVKWDLYKKSILTPLPVRCLPINDVMTQINPYALTGPVCKLFKTEIVRKNALQFPVDMSFGEDSVFVFSYLSNICKLQVVDSWGYYYCCSDNSLTTKADSDAWFLVACRVYDLSLRICEKNNIEDLYAVQYHFIDTLLQILKYEKRKEIRYKCYDEMSRLIGTKVMRQCMPFYFPLFACLKMWRGYDKLTNLIYNNDS